MPRVAIIMGIAFVLISNAYAQVISMSRPHHGLLGLIHTAREEAYNCSGDPAEKQWRVSEVTYDRRGNEIWRAYYNPDGSVGHQAGHTYDQDGNETGWTEFYGKNDFPRRGGISMPTLHCQVER